MKSRPPVPASATKELKTKNMFMCCICRNPDSAYELQIHHTDGNPSNNALDNLALLCFGHHNQANIGLGSGATGQGQKLTPRDVRVFKKQWEESVARRLQSTRGKPSRTGRRPNGARTAWQVVMDAQSRRTPLSGCVAEALRLAKEAGDEHLETFCSRELTGWTRRELTDLMRERHGYRIVPAFASPGPMPTQELLSSIGVDGVFERMRQSPDLFVTVQWPVLEPVSALEASQHPKPNEGIVTYNYRWHDLDESSDNPDAPAYIFVRATDYLGVLENVRAELTRQLLGSIG
jgi:hypothetical protein